MGARRGYVTDVSDEQWALVAPFVRPEQSQYGPKIRVERRAVVDAILYQLRTGCQWRLLPRDFPNWHTVRHYFDVWRRDGTLDRLNAALTGRVRVAAGKEPTPSVLVLDTQSVKGTELGGEVGIDGGKKGEGEEAGLGRRLAGQPAGGRGVRGQHR